MERNNKNANNKIFVYYFSLLHNFQETLFDFHRIEESTSKCCLITTLQSSKLFCSTELYIDSLGA